MDEYNHTVAEKNVLSILKHCAHFDYYWELLSLMNIDITKELHIYSYVPTWNGTKCVGTKGWSYANIQLMNSSQISRNLCHSIIFRIWNAFCLEKNEIPKWSHATLAGVSELLASPGHTGRIRVVLGHTLNTLQHIIAEKFHNVFNKFTILCWAKFIAILGCMQPTGDRLDTPVWAMEPGEI